MIQKVSIVQSWTGSHLEANLWTLHLHAMWRLTEDITMNARVHNTQLGLTGWALSKEPFILMINSSASIPSIQSKRETAKWPAGCNWWSMAHILVPRLWLQSQRSLEQVVQKHPSYLCKYNSHVWSGLLTTIECQAFKHIFTSPSSVDKNQRPQDLVIHESMECPKLPLHPLLMLLHRYVWSNFIILTFLHYLLGQIQFVVITCVLEDWHHNWFWEVLQLCSGAFWRSWWTGRS